MSGNNTAYAVFTACQNSHEFEERRVPLVHNAEQVKIGRAVARVRAMPDNAIFDCKVLSRTHALIWYEDEKFYLKDTKSSNGTFVNNQRLSKGGEDSAPKEIFSGDIIQLGVDIVENAKKTTFNCIIAMTKLYYPDMREAVPSPQQRSESMASSSGMTESGGGGPLAVAPPGSAVLSAQELFQLQQYIREAAHREQMMRSKLEQIDALFTTCHASADSAWQALIDEDRLLSRIEMLENQLELYKKKNVDPAGGDTRMRDDLERMLEEKYDYEQKSKEMLRRAHQENIEAAQRLTDAEQSLASTEKAVERLTDEVQAARSHIATLDTLHAQALAKLQEVETERAKIQSRLDSVESDGQDVAALKQNVVDLTNKVQSMEAAAAEANDVLAASKATATGENNTSSVFNLEAAARVKDAELVALRAELASIKMVCRTPSSVSNTDTSLTALVHSICEEVLLPYKRGDDDGHLSDASSESGTSVTEEKCVWIDDAVNNLTARLTTSFAKLLPTSPAVSRVARDESPVAASPIAANSAQTTNEIELERVRSALETALADAAVVREQMLIANEIARVADERARIADADLAAERHANSQNMLVRTLGELRAQADSVTFMSAVPLVILFVCWVIAFHPFFAWFTATDDPPPANVE